MADEVLKSKVHRLPPERFRGAGVYVIYYTGDFELYKPLAESNRENRFATPIYIGKAVPEGTRKGNSGLNENVKDNLYKRLCEHADSVNSTTNLDINDFFCRYLSVDEIWIPLAETILISRFNPLWNTVVEGFGNHDPGKGRKTGKKPKWDMLHPGRPWAYKLANPSITLEDLESLVKQYMAKSFS